MEILLLIVPLAFIIGLLFLFMFSWSVNSGQLDDLDTPALRILLEDDIVVQEKEKEFKEEE